MAKTKSEIHIGDIGTQYRIRLTDLDIPFNPEDATVKTIIWKMPDDSIVERAATLEDVGVGDDIEYFLTYTVTSGSFHAVVGNMSIQIYLEFPDGQRYHSNIQPKDMDGVPLKIFANLN